MGGYNTCYHPYYNHINHLSFHEIQKEIGGDSIPNPVEVEYTKKLISLITNYFRDENYGVYAEITDHSAIETKEGIDAVIIVGDKLLGLQVKRPYPDGMVRYHLSEHQHDIIQKNDWVLYAFPENIPRREFKHLLHRTYFHKGNFPFSQRITLGDISGKKRWGSIERGIKECPVGLIIQSKDDISSLHKNLINT